MKSAALILLALAATCAAQFLIDPYRFGSAAPNTGLTCYWKLDEASGAGARVDSGPNGQDLTPTIVQASTNAVISLGCNYGSGSTDRSSHVDSATLSCGDIDFTIAGWFMAYDTTTRGYVLKGGLLSAAVIEWGIYMNANVFKFITGNGTTYNTANWASSPTLNTWYFIVGWHDATANTVNIQINNGSVVSTAHTVGCQDGTGGFTVGSATDGFQCFGAVDELGFWKRVLTDAEKTYLYNSGAGRTCCPFP